MCCSRACDDADDPLGLQLNGVLTVLVRRLWRPPEGNPSLLRVVQGALVDRLLQLAVSGRVTPEVRAETRAALRASGIAR